MNWILVSIFLPLAGLAAMVLCLPKNRGKKQAPKQFTIGYARATKGILAAIIAAMVGLVALLALLEPAALSAAALYYNIYLVTAGLLLGVLVHTLTFRVTIDGEKITITRRRKETSYTAADLERLDIRKNELRVYSKKGEVLFTVSAVMENLDLFFAYTHAHPKIRLTAEGKEFKQHR